MVFTSDLLICHQVEDVSALTMLEEVTTVESRQDVAMTLVKIYLGQGLVVPFLDYLNTREVIHTSKMKESSTQRSKTVPWGDVQCSELHSGGSVVGGHVNLLSYRQPPPHPTTLWNKHTQVLRPISRVNPLVIQRVWRVRQGKQKHTHTELYLGWIFLRSYT